MASNYDLLKKSSESLDKKDLIIKLLNENNKMYI